MWKHRWLTNTRFCKAHLARQVPEEILTEIVFLDIIYTALNILCKSSDTNQSSILNINSYTLSYTQILANELINTYSLAATSSLHQALWDCIFFVETEVVSTKRKKKEAAPRSQLLAVTKWTLLQAYVRKKNLPDFDSLLLFTHLLQACQLPYLLGYKATATAAHLQER